MSHIENLIQELRKAGINTEQMEVVKNGVICKGLRLVQEPEGNHIPSISPIVYYSEEESLSVIADRVYQVLQSQQPVIDPALITDWSFVQDHLYLGVQCRSEENILKKAYLNLEITARIYIDLARGNGKDAETGTIKVTADMADMLGVSEEVLWNEAVENSRPLYHIRSLSDVLGIRDENLNLYVATADLLTDAASVLYYPDLFQEFCETGGYTGCLILPSSTQEVLCYPFTSADESEKDPQKMADLVKEINETQVDPRIRLEPCCYRYSLQTGIIEIAAVADA